MKSEKFAKTGLRCWSTSPCLWLALVSFLVVLPGCWSSSGSEVVVYSAHDQEFSEPVLKDFAAETKIRVLPKFDTESTKTLGLAEAIIAEANRPRCDVFWNNEILHTVRLEELGLLEPYKPPTADEFPAMDRSSDGTWYGFAARARVLIVNTKNLEESARPTSINDLVDPKYKDRVGIAKPLFGTTATHAACLFQAWGDEKAKEYFRQLHANAKVMPSNKYVAIAVAHGQLDFGLTDTDDAIGELEKGMPVAIVYPDQQPDGIGTLFIPNTLSIIKGCPHPAAARKLVDYLLTAKVEDQLAESMAAQIPLHPNAKGTTRVQTPATVRPMQVDFKAAAEKWKQVAEFLQSEFTGGN